MRKLIIFLGLFLVFFLFKAFKNNSLPAYLEQNFEQTAENFKQENFNEKGFKILIDFRRPIFEKRLWLIDSNGKVELHCHVTHAHKSGLIYANYLSNIAESEKSCAGLLVTQEAYFGQFGKSMRLAGLQKAINDNTRMRNIVFHPIPTFKIWGMRVPEWLLWYSDGCFATTKKNMEMLVDKAANSCFVYVLPKN